MPERIVVGVDAGGSRTVAIAAQGQTVFEPFSCGPANPASAGVERAAESIAAAVAGALGTVPADGVAADAVYAGVAGAWSADVAEALRVALVARLAPARVAVTNDVEIALRAAVPQGDALLLVAGTGSIAYGEIGERRFRCGGLGHALGDEGSGYAIGAAAVRLLARALDGRALRDPMLDAVAAKLGIDDPMVAIAFSVALDAAPGSGVAALASVAPIVIEHAGAGERTANKIVQAAALDLFELVRALVRLCAAGERELPIVFAGGLLAENSLLTYLLETRIANEFPRMHIVKGAPAPHMGALAAARRLAERA